MISPFFIWTYLHTITIIKEVPARARITFSHQRSIRLYRATITALVTRNTIISYQQLLNIAIGACILVTACFTALWTGIACRLLKVVAIFTFGALLITAGQAVLYLALGTDVVFVFEIPISLASCTRFTVRTG